MATDPTSITTIYEFLVALRDDPEFRTEYAAEQQQLIDSLPNMSAEDKELLNTGTEEDVQQALRAHENYEGQIVNITYRYIHI